MSERSALFVSDEVLLEQEQYRHAVKELEKKQKSFYIQTFGCQLNDHDSETIAGQMVEMGFVQASSWDDADIVFLNSCSIRENADQRFFGHLGRLKHQRRERANMIIAVCGCMMKIDEHVDRITTSYPFVDLLFGPSDIYRLGELMHRRLSGSRRVYDIGDDDVIAEGLHVVHERKYRALCTIMYGCNNFCTYCIVPFTRGRERSRAADDIVREVQILAEQGFSEVMLLGQNVNSYGLDALSPNDREKNHPFCELLRRLCRETAIKRIRFMTSHPKDISIELLELMAHEPQIEKHLHLPLQSGSDRILKKMNRHYTREQYLTIAHKAKQLMPDLGLTTDIIVGFPGESEDDFRQTLDAVAELGFDSAFTFQYSPRRATPAALLKEQIDPELMQERFNRLMEIQNRNSLRANETRVGKRYEVLIEGLSDHNAERLTGRASDFHLINFSLPQELLSQHGWEKLSMAELGYQLEGSFARVLVDEAKTFSLGGSMEKVL